MASLNCVTLIGRLTRKPEMRYTPSGKAVANFDLAVDRRKGQAQDCDFVPVVVWEKLAEVCNEYLAKGKLVAIQGRLQTRTYEKDGQKRKTFEVLAFEMQMLGSSQERPQQRQQQQEWASDGYGSDIGLEDIPF